MLLSKPSAWFLVLLQVVFAGIFLHFLSAVPALQNISLSYSPGWYQLLVFVQVFLSFLLGMVALFRPEWVALVLMGALQIICPLIFFTDLTKNPYFTQITFLNIWVILLFLTLIFEGWIQKKWLFPKSNVGWPFLLFFVWGTISWIHSFMVHQPRLASSIFFEGLKTEQFFLINCIGVFYLAAMLEQRFHKTFLLLTFTVAGIAATYGLMQFYGLETIWTQTVSPYGNRPISTFGNPNFLSTYLLLTIPPLILFSTQIKKPMQLFFSFSLLVVLIMALIATMTRSSWVGMISSIVALPIFPPVRNFIKKHKRNFIFAAAMLALFILFFPQNHSGGYSGPWQRITEIKLVKSTGVYAPWYQRILIWSSAWNMQSDHPIMGKGWGQFELFFPFYQGDNLFIPLLQSYRTHANNAHNELLEVWSQTGFIGTGIYIWLWTLLIFGGYRIAKNFSGSSKQDRAMLNWAFVCAAFGAGVDNFFGNVSLHFAVPAMLFWWQAGLLQNKNIGAEKSDKSDKSGKSDKNFFILPRKNIFCGLGAVFIAAVLMVFATLSFRKQFQEIYYFYGSKYQKNVQTQSIAKESIETAWKWYPKEVYTNYDLGNIYVNLAQQSEQLRLPDQVQMWNKKALWAYQEALDSINSYDEIYYNFAAVENKVTGANGDFSNLSAQDPNGKMVTLKVYGTPITHLEYALAINPLSKESYGLLSAIYLQDIAKNKAALLNLFQRATYFFPEVQTFWINRAFIEFQDNHLEESYASLKHSLEIDPNHAVTINNIRGVLAKMNRKTDPLLEVIDTFANLKNDVAARNWVALEQKLKRCTEIIPKNFSSNLLLANVYFEEGKFSEAEQFYLKANQIKPDDLGVLRPLAVTYLKENKPDLAKNIYQKIIAIDPQDTAAKSYLSVG